MYVYIYYIIILLYYIILYYILYYIYYILYYIYYIYYIIIYILYIYIYTITKRIFVVIIALECSMGRAYMNKVMINKGLETTQHLMLLQVSCVSSNHQAFI